MDLIRTFTVRISTMCWACFFSQATLSEEANTLQPIEDILITATKRPVHDFDFPGAASLYDSSWLSAQPTANLGTLAGQTPGLSILDTGARNPTPIITRGLRVEAVSANDYGGDGGTMAIYVDNSPLQGYYLPPEFPLKDLKQVEVLRGPQGTLYGNASLGGVLRYVTAQPELTETYSALTASVSTTRHSSGLGKDLDAVINLPLVENQLGLRLLVGQKTTPGFIDNPYLLSGPAQDINREKTELARLSLRWEPSTQLSLTASYHHQEQQAGDRQATNQAFTQHPFHASSHYLQPVDSTLQLGAVNAEYLFGTSQLAVTFSQYRYQADTLTDQTDFLLTLDDTYDWGFYRSYDDFSAYTVGDFHITKDSQEIRWSSLHHSDIHWLLGLFHSTDNARGRLQDITPGFPDFIGMDRPDALDYYATQQEQLTETAAYTDLSYAVTHAWTLGLGSRYYRYRSTLEICSVFPLLEGIEGNALPLECHPGEEKHQGSLWKLNSLFQLHPHHHIYISITEGFRRGGANALPVTLSEHHVYAPDKTLNYELGWHSQLWQQRTRFSISAFYIDWRNIQIPSYTTDGYPIIINSRQAESTGVEWQLQTRLSKTLSLRAGATYTNAHLSQDMLIEQGAEMNMYRGDRLPGSPKQQWSLSLAYSGVFDRLEVDGLVSLNRVGSLTTALNHEHPGYKTLPGFSLVNASVGFNTFIGRFFIFVDNLTDKRAVTGERDASHHGPQGRFEYITRPRTLGIGVHHSF